MISALFIVIFALLNRARGSTLFGLTTSTVVSRLVATFGMASLIAFVALPYSIPFIAAAIFAYSWAMLMLWCTPAWDAYWSAEIGNDPAHSRLWGLGMMTLRMLLAVPAIAGDALLAGHPERSMYALGCLLLGLPYYLAGFFTTRYAVMIGELTDGAILGLQFYLVTGNGYVPI